MSGALSPMQRQELLWTAGMAPRTYPPQPLLRRQLVRKGLVRDAGGVTQTGRAAALLGGYALNDSQQQLVCALAEGTVASSNRWDLPRRAPAGALKALRDAGAARARLWRGVLMYDATSLGHQVAVVLRQQALPPLWALTRG